MTAFLTSKISGKEHSVPLWIPVNLFKAFVEISILA